MHRYFIELSYDGKHYHGWQLQNNALTVQEVLEKGLSTLLKRDISIMGSGRTDTGVHATQQFAQFDSPILLDKLEFLKKINGILPPTIAIHDLRLVKKDAHARFHAISRSYIYKITLEKNPFYKDSHWLYYKALDVEKMNAAATILKEYKDFESFSKVHTDVHTFLCQLFEAKWEQNGYELLFNISANRFLRGMVRAIVGTLVEVGTGKVSLEEFRNIIEAKNRKKAKAAAPAQGLYLCRVQYPESIFI
ncbi:tRNA pseudouridine(38-40) synthase TruA [Mongoliitalea daihaiensis]|uniref:tRNA pseudouridine(38-40) synthase TruA n=1 Tax=Mongoliitalea daihaiensis TaxID=2782006 RepID=UPI00293E0793|nr:tRNA pseudouridine(38-40) synthase TruA [Mongoliitalea daihaiensis]